MRHNARVRDLKNHIRNGATSRSYIFHTKAALFENIAGHDIGAQKTASGNLRLSEAGIDRLFALAAERAKEGMPFNNLLGMVTPEKLIKIEIRDVA